MRKSSGARPEGFRQSNLGDSTIRLRQYQAAKGAGAALHVLAPASVCLGTQGRNRDLGFVVFATYKTSFGVNIV